MSNIIVKLTSQLRLNCSNG